MAATVAQIDNTNQIVLPDVKSIVGYINNLKGVDMGKVKRNLHTLENISGYIVRYYEIMGDMSNRITKVLDQAAVNGFNDLNIIIKNTEGVAEGFKSIVYNTLNIEKGNLLKSTLAQKKFDVVANNIKNILEGLSLFFEDVGKLKLGSAGTTVEGLNTFISRVTNIIKDIINIAKLALPLKMSIPLALIAFRSVGTFIKGMSFILTEILTYTHINFVGLTSAMTSIVSIVASMTAMVGLVLANIILVAATLPILQRSGLRAILALGVISLVVVAVAGIATLVNKVLQAVGGNVFAGMGLMLSIMGMMLLTTGMIMLLAAAGTILFANNLWLNALGMFALTSSLVIAIAGLGYLITVMLPGITAFTLGVVLVMASIGAMLVIGTELNALMRFDFDKSKRASIKSVSGAIVGAARDIIDAVFNGFDDEGNIKSDDSNIFVRFMKGLVGGAAIILQALTASLVLVMTTVSVTMLLIIGAELNVLARYEVDKDNALRNVNSIMGTANAIINAIFEPAEDRNTPGGSGFIGALKHFFTGFADILELIASIGKLSLMMVSIAFIRMLAGELKWVNKFNTGDIAGVGGKVNSIISAAQACIDAINQPADTVKGEGDKSLKKLLKWVLPDSLVDMVDMFLKIGKLSAIITCVGLVHRVAEQLSTINSITFDEQSIRTKVDTILSSANKCIGAISESLVKPSKSDWKSLENFEHTSLFMERFGTSLLKLSNAMNGVDPSKLQKVSDVLKPQNPVDSIISCIDSISSHNINTRNYNTNIKAIDSMITTLSKLYGLKGGDKYKESINKGIEFINTVNDSKLEHLKTATNMFSKMAEFSKSINGNFQGLANTINDKIIPVMTEFNKTLDRTNNMAGSGKFNGFNSGDGGASVSTSPSSPSKTDSNNQTTNNQIARSFESLKQELTNIRKALTDGSQRTSIEAK